MVSGGTIMILGASQAVFFTLLLITKKNKTTKDFLLVSYLMLLIVHLWYYFSMFFLPGKVPQLVGVLGFSLVILHTPIFFLYVRSLALEKHVSFKIVLLHTLPYAIYNTIILFGESINILELQPQNGFLGISKTEYSIFYQSGQALAIITVGYIVWGFSLLKSFRKRVKNNESSLTSTKWMNFLVFSFLCYFLSIYAVLSFALDGGLIPASQVFYYVSFIIMAFVFALGFFGIKQQAVFTNLQLSRPETKYAKSGLTDAQIDQIAITLREAMDKEHVFLNPDVSLPDLASQLDIKAPYLSQVINQRFKSNFYDFINRYRVEEVKKRIADPSYQHLSLLGIALDCGFKSKSSFNKSFKKHTGLTPSDFKNTQ